jgi:putative membrane protein insertion efficiency factor
MSLRRIFPGTFLPATFSPGTFSTFFPRLSLPRILARALVKVYRLTLSPLVGSNCRHLPTCSNYADEAFARHGFWAGGWMTLARLLRCHPFGTFGLDFVPEAPPSDARWYLPWRYGRWRGTNTTPPHSRHS